MDDRGSGRTTKQLKGIVEHGKNCIFVVLNNDQKYYVRNLLEKHFKGFVFNRNHSIADFGDFYIAITSDQHFERFHGYSAYVEFDHAVLPSYQWMDFACCQERFK